MKKVECPNCGLKFKFNPKRVNPADGTFDCPRCDEILKFADDE